LDFLPSSIVSELITSAAERKCYGLKHKEAVPLDDETPEALWVWEVRNLSLMPTKLSAGVLAER